MAIYSTKVWRKIKVILMLCFLEMAPSLLFAHSEVGVVLDEDSRYFQNLLMGLQVGFGGKTEEVYLNKVPQEKKTMAINNLVSHCKLLVAVGGRAIDLIAELQLAVPVIAVGDQVQLRRVETPSNVHFFNFEVTPKEELLLIKNMLPASSSVGLIYNVKSSKKFLTIQSTARTLGIKLIGAKTYFGREAKGVIKTILPKIDSFWLFNDSGVLNIEAFEELMAVAQETQVLFFGLGEASVVRNAVASLSVDVLESARRLGAELKQILEGDRDVKVARSAFNSSIQINLNLSQATKNPGAELLMNAMNYAKERNLSLRIF